MKIRSKVKSGALGHNHNQNGLAVKTKLKSGSLGYNHNQTVR